MNKCPNTFWPWRVDFYPYTLATAHWSTTTSPQQGWTGQRLFELRIAKHNNSLSQNVLDITRAEDCPNSLLSAWAHIQSYPAVLHAPSVNDTDNLVWWGWQFCRRLPQFLVVSMSTQPVISSRTACSFSSVDDTDNLVWWGWQFCRRLPQFLFVSVSTQLVISSRTACPFSWRDRQRGLIGMTVLQKIASIPCCQREHAASHIQQGCMLLQLTR